ncbi:MAG TPA: hypothetical protein PKH79_00745 [Prolixibacteraceae bacterium]|nr:hypothetical protein [Prolixibacteraceae bacterium]
MRKIKENYRSRTRMDQIFSTGKTLSNSFPVKNEQVSPFQSMGNK